MGAFPSTTTPVNITLFRNVPFDNKYKHHSFIYPFTYNNVAPTGSGTRVQRNFLYRKILDGSSSIDAYPHNTLTDVYNFDFKNGLYASVYLSLTSTERLSNYMEVSSGNERWYYFITDITQSNNDVYKLELECDVIMTYGSQFMQGMRNIPVFTARKHCNRYSNDGFTFCWDYKTGDTTFNGVKPSIIKSKIDCVPAIENRISYNTGHTENFSDILWLYIVCDNNETGYFNIGGVYNPYTLLCIPCNIYKLSFSRNLSSAKFTINIFDSILKLINDGHIKSAKVSHVPPFNDYNTSKSIVYYDDTNGGELHIMSEDTNTLVIDGYDSQHDIITAMHWNSGNGCILYGDNRNNSSYAGYLLSYFQSKNDIEYYYKSVSLENFKKEGSETITSNRVEDTKLLFPPFRKYVYTCAGGEETELHMELLTSLSPFTLSNQGEIYLRTISTQYGGDYTFFTYPRPITLKDGVVGFANYKNAKQGLSMTTNYTIPVGTDALDVWKSTQSETYYQSKTASGITSGLSIVSGIGMIAGGAVMTATGGASPLGIGMIGAGTMQLAGGIAGEVDVVKSINAKQEDLENTPNTINVSGSSYAHDLAMGINGLHPYFLVYETTPNVKYSADNLFYKYGYEVGRDCYFNSNILSNKENETSQCALFTRTIFNYIQISEDITNKIENANIPFIVKQKFSQIFNSGITLWTYMGFTSLNTLGTNVETATYNLDNWLFKIKLENKEWKGETF